MAQPVKVTDRDKRHNKRRSAARDETLDSRKLREYFLIVTNGSETEARYFERIKRKMPRNALRQIEVDFRQGDPMRTVDRALEMAGLNCYQHVAVVFDKDDFEHFNNAISKMKAAAKRDQKPDETIEFYTAYSNECFELWMLLHFQEVCAPLGRDSLFDKLRDHVSRIKGQEYRYDKADFPFELLDNPGNLQEAICRAKRMLEEAEQQDLNKPWTINPTTEVHILIEKIDEFVLEK